VTDATDRVVADRPPRDLSRQSLAEVVEPRYDELFTLIQGEIRRSGFEELIPAGVVLTGGTSKMEGVVELAEEIFHMPVRVGAPQYTRGMHDSIRTDKIDAFDVVLDHVTDCVTSATANTDHFDNRVLRCVVY
jgi:cell division protein FtsA